MLNLLILSYSKFSTHYFFKSLTSYFMINMFNLSIGVHYFFLNSLLQLFGLLFHCQLNKAVY